MGGSDNTDDPSPWVMNIELSVPPLSYVTDFKIERVILTSTIPCKTVDHLCLAIEFVVGPAGIRRDV